MSELLYQRRGGFVGIPNETANDQRLSCRAMGLLVILLSRPPGASLDMRQIAQGEGREGRDSLLRAAKLLRVCGYLHSIKCRAERGRYTTLTVVSGSPMTPDEANETLREMRAACHGSVLSDPLNPENPTPVNQTPVNETPEDLTLALGSSLRSHLNHQKGATAQNQPICHACGQRHRAQELRCLGTHTPGMDVMAALRKAAKPKPKRLDENSQPTARTNREALPA